MFHYEYDNLHHRTINLDRVVFDKTLYFEFESRLQLIVNPSKQIIIIIG